ncbi:LCP family protein [Labedaea rhizosphaerae]|uniref:LytR family transcriptional attenuator n=1 Tax=Labedaea rhizosphaerae TaxID=598644 RepID=A0A4R6SN42_LABRH|nr:LCP family protein [Labedaea rhizosphaerae]TDQ05447.1 LytR family transcriptional attenuator [Labedaea rhizosphaerae]
METSGGVSVSDLVQRHTGSRPDLPLPGSEPGQRTGRRALPDPPQSGGRRRAPEPPAATNPPTGRRRAVTSHSSMKPVPPPTENPVQSPGTTSRRAPAPNGRPPANGHAAPANGHAAPTNGANGHTTGTSRANGYAGNQPPAQPPAQPPVQPPAPPAGRAANGHTGARPRTGGTTGVNGRPDAGGPVGPTGRRTPAGPSAPPPRRRTQPSGQFPPVPPPGATNDRPGNDRPGTDRPGTDRLDQEPRRQPGQESALLPVPPPGTPPSARPQHPSLPRFVPLPPPRSPQEQAPAKPGPKPGADPQDILGLTTEMEPIDESVQKRRKVDHTLARFSAVHDQMAEEERKRKAKRLLPWGQPDEEMEAELTHLSARPLDQPQAAEADEDPESDPQSLLEQKKGRRRHLIALTLKIVALVLAILIFVVTALAWGAKQWFDNKFNEVSALDQNSQDVKNAAAQADDENFLLVGSDTRAGATADEHVGDSAEVQGARSDTIMIAHVPKDRTRVEVISFPRDLEVTRPVCQRWDSKTGKYSADVPGATEVKLNSVYAVGGPKCVTKTVQKISGLNINHFIGIDFQGFKGMVDAVQGVEVCVEHPLKDTVLGTIVPQAGKAVNLTGDEALNFVRARHVIGDPTSDYGRIIRQQRFLSSLLRKAMSGQVLLDPGKLSGFVNAFAGSTFTDNVDSDQLMTLGQSLQRLSAGGVLFITVPTVGEANERGNEVLREADTRALFDAIINDTPLPGEKPATPAPNQPKPKPVDPHTVKIQVLNGGNTTGGIAGTTSDKLHELGYQIVRVDNAPDKVDHTVVRYGPDHADAAKALAATVPGARLEADESMAGAVVLVIGPEYDGTVKNGKSSGSSTQAPPTSTVPSNLTTVNAADVSCV